MAEDGRSRREVLRLLGGGLLAGLAGCRRSGGGTTVAPDTTSEARTGTGMASDTPGTGPADSLDGTETIGTADESTAAPTETPEATGNVPMFRYDPANTGYAPAEVGPTAGLARTWTFETDDIVFSSPAVVEGAGSGSGGNATVYLGSNDRNVYALGEP